MGPCGSTENITKPSIPANKLKRKNSGMTSIQDIIDEQELKKR